MPIYVYACETCGRTEERLETAKGATAPYCHGLMQKQVTAPAIRFSGSGWQTPSPKN